jgi:NAD(P)-dependent dehydrogenase (short-subunit alcohol dehydrogenase family)
LNPPPDVLVSNAAVTLSKADIRKSDPELVAQEIDINVKGPYLMARAYVDAVNAANRKGCLINVR